MDEGRNYDGELTLDIVDEEFAGLHGPDVVCTNHIVTIPANFQRDTCRYRGRPRSRPAHAFRAAYERDDDLSNRLDGLLAVAAAVMSAAQRGADIGMAGKPGDSEHGLSTSAIPAWLWPRL